MNESKVDIDEVNSSNALFAKMRDYIKKENQKFSRQFVECDLSKSKVKVKPDKTYRNKDFLVQVFFLDNDYVRMSVNISDIVEFHTDKGPIWKDGISWDDLQLIKAKLGYGDRDAVECYPKDKDVVNVANIRHLFILPKDHDFPFFWRAT